MHKRLYPTNKQAQTAAPSVRWYDSDLKLVDPESLANVTLRLQIDVALFSRPFVLSFGFSPSTTSHGTFGNSTTPGLFITTAADLWLAIYPWSVSINDKVF